MTVYQTLIKEMTMYIDDDFMEVEEPQETPISQESIENAQTQEVEVNASEAPQAQQEEASQAVEARQPEAPEPTSADPAQTASSVDEDIESLRQQVVSLTSQLAEANDKLMSAPNPVPSLPEGVKLPPAGQVTTVGFIENMSEEDYADLISSPAKFNELLNKVATVAYTAAVNAAQENIMRQIPNIVNTSAQQQAYIQSITTEFYKENADLLNYKSTVAMAIQQVCNEEPNIPIKEALAKAAERTRQVLRIRPESRRRMPAQPAGNSVSGSGVDRLSSAPQMSEQQRQIMELLSI